MQLDSWWYPHRTIRPFDTDEWDVPPTGLDRWEARDDILPDGIAALRAELGDPPLVVALPPPVVGVAVPWTATTAGSTASTRTRRTPSCTRRTWTRRSRGGCETFEHDWLVECFLGVRGLREAPGARSSGSRGWTVRWRDRGMTAQWCMATPADMMATTPAAAR